jgi:shikimate kinase
MPSNVYMIGFMCAGKSKIGSLLAMRLNWKHLDTDTCIIEETGMSISEIFEKMGEPAFRTLEKKWIRKTVKLKNHVISLGGGAVLDPENWDAITSSGITVALSYPAEIIHRRATQKMDRPLLNQKTETEKMAQIQNLLEKRREYYNRADLVLHLNREIEADRVADMIAGYLGVWR